MIVLAVLVTFQSCCLQMGFTCSLYNNTRDLSANAVAAGQAYKNIVKFINAAHNNSQEAVDDADTALNEVRVFYF